MPGPSSVHGFQPRWMPALARVEAVPLQLAGPQRAPLDHQLHAGAVGHDGGQPVDRGLRPRADVADEPASPVGGPHEGVDHVVDVDEVAGLLAVAEDDEGQAPQQALGEDGHHAGLAVGVLARAVHVGQGQGAELEGVQLTVGLEVVDGRLLGDAVGRQRTVGQRLAQWQLRVVRLPVEGPATGGEHHTPATGQPGALEYPEGAEQVHVGVEHRVGHRHPHVGLGGQVERPPRAGGDP